ncbi:procollagen C-endopeptidase enhancer 1 isoform X2 [Ammospiza nelsoni]|uniref:procollagen C-endopeptidase enhancer 1 n=1 Tax=Ammospiza caudacuta TaxID=2857398 RepID=UPI00273A25E3|nr:procollagen C-endopeptidase enhancer 1 [Ammospiza caudacuta]XP_059346615.1 procollagen C-endopeptidase enhancer 1 isoform X2 [Ammospiza nelsoni]
MSRLGPPLPLLLLGALGALSPPRAAGQEPPPSPPPSPRPNATRPVFPVFPCGGDHRGESGFIASEGFPRHYPPGSNCTWTITVPEGQVATLSFRVFDLEPDPRCRFDALSVFGGHGPAAPLLGRFCGTFRPGALRAPQNRLRLTMESDGATAGRGFLAWFSAGSPPSHEHQFCGGRLEKPQGSLSTPNWPEENYPPGISCSWHIVAPPGKVVELRFGKFDVEPDPHCRYDYVAVFEGGARDDARRLGRFCGEETPGPIVSSSPELLVQFVSDLSVTADGFSASYTLRDPAGASETPETPAPKPRGGPKAKAPPGPKAEPVPTAAPCPQRCRRAGTLQSNFCSSDFVLTGTVKSVSRGPAQEPGWAVLSVLGVYKAAAALGLPQPAKGSSLRVQMPCRLCPALKKGSSYVLMGRLGTDGAALLPPDAFVVPYRPQQQQVLGNLSKRPCRGSP